MGRQHAATVGDGSMVTIAAWIDSVTVKDRRMKRLARLAANPENQNTAQNPLPDTTHAVKQPPPYNQITCVAPVWLAPSFTLPLGRSDCRPALMPMQ